MHGVEEVVAITSDFHAPRARHLFGVAFGVHARCDVRASVEEHEAGMSGEALEARREHEELGLKTLRTAPFGAWAIFVQEHRLEACNKSIRWSRHMTPAVYDTNKTMLFDPSAGVSANVEPVVLFAIIDHYSRREEEQEFVVGTLLGTEEGGVVTICSSFPVPYSEVEDGQIALNTDFHHSMLKLQQQVTPKLKVVGWYSTLREIENRTSLFHDFYGQVAERPVHLLYDLGLAESKRMGCKAYVSSAITLGEEEVATCFLEVALTVVSGESDRVGIETLNKMTTERDEARTAALNTGKGEAAGELDSVEATIKKLLHTLEGVTDHVEAVVKGGATAEPAVVRLLQQLVASAPRLQAESFSKMFNTQVQDMLTVVYLANLTRTQLALAEKLHAITLGEGVAAAAKAS